LLLALIVLHFLGVPVFEKIWSIGNSLLSFIVFV